MDHFNEISENLQGGLNNHEKDFAQQTEIRHMLQVLKKLHSPSLQDLSTLVNTSENALARVQHEVIEGR